MLMTVQDIPDISAQQTKTLKLNQSKGIAAIPTTSQQKHLLAPSQSSSSAGSSVLTVKQQSLYNVNGNGSNSNSPQPQYTNNNNNHSAVQQRELYETSSTTTLTPPPSESGRETPLARSSSANKREFELQQTERDLIMSLSDQRSGGGSESSRMNSAQHSFLYPQQARVETLSITSDTDDDATNTIPYHAREDSRPFTYGITPSSGSGRNTPASAPPSGTMLKHPSGLSSPSMVRKALGGGVGGSYSEKAKPRNEFEEMLLERREKILNGDKYSIGDRTPNGSSANYESKWYTTASSSATPTNGYSPHDLLKRSNTMDGSFGRSLTPSEG